MKCGTTQSFAPLHLVVLATDGTSELLETIEHIREGAGYPHALTVVELSGKNSAREALQELQQEQIVQNVVLPEAARREQFAASVPLEVLGVVDAPYTVLISSGVNLHRVGWLRRILEAMLRSEAPAIGCNGAPDPERAVAPLASRDLLKEYLTTPGHTVAITRAELEELGVYAESMAESLQIPMLRSSGLMIGCAEQ